MNGLRVSPSPDSVYSHGYHSDRTSARSMSDVNILSYYESADADMGTAYNVEDLPEREYDAQRKASSNRRPPLRRSSSSSSAYSVDSPQATPSKSDNASTSGTRHRRNTPSEGGSDRRRMHIVETSHASKENGDERAVKGKRSADLRVRRGKDAELALVAPPDASPGSYSYLTPPPTGVPHSSSKQPSAPPQLSVTPDDDDDTDPTNHHHHQQGPSEAFSTSATLGHGQSTLKSPASSSTKSPREVGILGNLTTDFPGRPPPQQLTPNTQLQPPLFQVPQSRSSSPGNTPSDSESTSQRGRNLQPVAKSVPSPIITPEIGSAKQIHQPVAAPVVVALSPEQNASLGPFPSPPFSPDRTDPFLHYQPGLHATAGPLPPPPRAIFSIDASSPPPPRPPRLHSPPPPSGARRRGDTEAVKQALQLPASVTDGPLRSKTSKTSLRSNHTGSERSASVGRKGDHVDASNDPLLRSSAAAPKHTREGAFPPSTIISQPRSESPEQLSRVSSLSKRSQRASLNKKKPRPKLSMDDLVAEVGDAIDEVGIMSSRDVPPPTVLEPPHEVEDLTPRDVRHEGSTHGTPSPEWNSPPSSEGASPEPELEQPPLARITRVDKENHSVEGHRNSPPRANLKSSFATFNKRFSSLPRTPSFLSSRSGSAGKRSSTGSQSTRSPSPTHAPLPMQPHAQPRVRHKIRTRWPDAMSSADVVGKRSAAERSYAYATKINELWMCDCGLGDWVLEATYKGSSSSRTLNTGATLAPPGANTQLRHPSRSSMASEVTFPRRPDAYTATDLSKPRLSDDRSPANAPPPLPYPSLANATPLRTPTSSMSPPATARAIIGSPSKSGGFFASLGRKASVKRDRLGPISPTGTSSSSEAPRKVLSKPQPTSSAPSPRPINITSTPSVPGGPRAPSNRMQRSQTIMVAPLASTTGSTSSTGSRSGVNRNSSVVRRPSVLGMTASEPVINIGRKVDPEFARQVDKLADLLPQANRDVLAGYLRRAGQDILAIGQYLEDEKNGTIREADE